MLYSFTLSDMNFETILMPNVILANFKLQQDQMFGPRPRARPTRPSMKSQTRPFTSPVDGKVMMIC